MGMEKGKMDHDKMMMKDRTMPTVAFTAVAPHTASGTYQIVVKDGKHWLKVSDDFTSGGSPDAFVYLAKDGKVDNSAVELGQLAATSGGGSFEIKDPKKLAWYNTVVIFSKAHNLPVATAPIHQMMKHDRMMAHDSGMMMKKHDEMMKRDSGMMQKP